MNTQQSFEQLNPRAVAVVIDPIQSVKGKVVIDAFRLINPGGGRGGGMMGMMMGMGSFVYYIVLYCIVLYCIVLYYVIIFKNI